METTLKNSLKAMRFNNNNMTQAELAEKADVSRQTIIAIEQGKFNPSVRLALIMSKIFACQVEDIFQINKEKTK